MPPCHNQGIGAISARLVGSVYMSRTGRQYRWVAQWEPRADAEITSEIGEQFCHREPREIALSDTSRRRDGL